MPHESDKLKFFYDIPDRIFIRKSVFSSLETYIRKNLKVEREISVPTSAGECSIILLEDDTIICLENPAVDNGELTDHTVTIRSNKKFKIGINLAFRDGKYDFHEQEISIEFK